MPSSARPHRRGIRSTWRPVLLRGIALFFVFLAGWMGLMSGVGVTERDLGGAGVLEHAYYALGLFVLGGLDLGTPIGGPVSGRALLWFAYFAAPLITASALIEAGVRLMSPLALRVRPLRDHVILGGAGRLSLLYIERLRRSDPRRTVVVVEQNAQHPSIGELRDVHRALVIVGDVTSDEILERLHVSQAHRLLFLTGDDFVNLDAAAKVLRHGPRVVGRVVAHVSNLGFMRDTAESSVAKDCAIFNGHEFAATYLVQEHLIARFRATPERDVVILAGFGRFGQTALHQLQQHAAGSFGHVLIVDELGARKERAFEEQPGFSDDYRRTVFDGDMLDPELWRRVFEVAKEDGRAPVVIIGSGDEGTNLHAALLVRKQADDALVIIRSFRASPFTTEIAKDTGIEAFNLAGLIESGMPEAWF